MSAEWWNVGRNEYHEDTIFKSHSALEVFRQSIPLYHAMYVDRSMARPSTKAMDVGSAFDRYLLEGTEDGILIKPENAPRTTNAGKAIWAEWLEKYGLEFRSGGELVLSGTIEGTEKGDDPASLDLIILTQDEWNRVRWMASSVYDNPKAKELLRSNGWVQQAIRGVDKATDLPIKCLFDKICENGSRIDLKSSATPYPEAFGRQAHNLGYHRQAAQYDLLGTEIGLEGPFYHIVTGSNPPFETIVYETGDSVMNLGHKQNAYLFKELQGRIEQDDWSPRDVMTTLKFPEWAFPKV